MRLSVIAVALGVLLAVCYPAYGEGFIYNSEGRRDPFIPLITGGVKTALGLHSVDSIDDIRFDGVVFDPEGDSYAVLNGEIVNEGMKITHLEIVEIHQGSVLIKILGQPHKIDLVEEGGE